MYRPLRPWTPLRTVPATSVDLPRILSSWTSPPTLNPTQQAVKRVTDRDKETHALFFSLSLYIYPDYRSSVRSLHVKMSNGTGRANTRAAFVRHTGCYSQRIALAERACLNLTCNFLARNSSRQPVPTRQEVGLHWTWQVMKAYPGSDDPKRHLTSGSGIH